MIRRIAAVTSAVASAGLVAVVAVVHVAQPPYQEPYGGCDEAYNYPRTPGWFDCAEHGLLPGWQPFRDVDGHTGCFIRVGDTSFVACRDGYTASS